MNSSTSTDNIFKIDNPNEWWCRVNSLTSAHSTMRIDVIRKDTTPHFSEVLPIELRKVAYFSGWMT
jgi:hypothetical protein